jgi:hypothetical protein
VWNGRTGRWHECEDGSIILVSSLTRYEERSQVFKCVSKYEHFVDGMLSQTELNVYAVRFYHPMEFESMLSKAGFENIRIISAQESGLEGTDSSIFECFRLN